MKCPVCKKLSENRRFWGLFALSVGLSLLATAIALVTSRLLSQEDYVDEGAFY